MADRRAGDSPRHDKLQDREKQIILRNEESQMMPSWSPMLGLLVNPDDVGQDPCIASDCAMMPSMSLYKPCTPLGRPPVLALRSEGRGSVRALATAMSLFCDDYCSPLLNFVSLGLRRRSPLVLDRVRASLVLFEVPNDMPIPD